jgi:hypothetical protein
MGGIFFLNIEIIRVLSIVPFSYYDSTFRIISTPAADTGMDHLSYDS